MPQITLPDGSRRSFDAPVTVQAIAADIGPGLAKATLAGRVNGRLVDASFVVAEDAEVSMVTAKDEDALELLRHDAAHVMAQAVQELYPGTQVTIGPAIENGFYYDFARDEPFTPEDLAAIEQRMHEIVARDLPIVREVWEREEAKRVFGELGETYKVQIIEDIIPEGEEVSRPTRSRSSRTSSPRAKRSRCTARASGSTSAAARTCRARASWAKASSS